MEQALKLMGCGLLLIFLGMLLMNLFGTRWPAAEPGESRNDWYHRCRIVYGLNKHDHLAGFVNLAGLVVVFIGVGVAVLSAFKGS